MNRPVTMTDSTAEAAERASYRRARGTTPVLIDLSSDDDDNNNNENNNRDNAGVRADGTRTRDIVRDADHRGVSPGADGRATVRAPARYGYDPAESDGQASDDEERDDDDISDIDNSQDSDDSDDDGSDLKDFIVSDDDEDDDCDGDDDHNNDNKIRAHGADSEGDFVPSDEDDDDDSDTPTDDEDENDSNDDDGTGDGDAVDVTDDQSSNQQDSTSGACSARDRVKKSEAPRAGIKATKKKSNDARNSVAGKRSATGDRDDDGDGDDDGDVVIVGTSSAASATEPRPAKRARLDEAEAPAIDPTNIVSGKRSRRATERYMDRHFMEFMVRDVPAHQIAAVFDDEDEYFRSGISLTDSSEDDNDDGSNEDMDREDDLDSSDYEALDALSSSTHPRSRQRTEDRRASGAAAPARDGAADVAIDMSRPPSTVAALLRLLAAQPGGIRPSVASPRSAPTARTPLLP